LNSTPKTVESVTIDADGRWSVATESSNSPVPDSEDDNDVKTKVVDLDDDDDRPMMRSTTSSFTTPAARPKAESVSRNNGNNKRPASHVIDLTLSDDDEPPRPTKRNNALPTPSSVGSGFSRLDSEIPNDYSPVGTPAYYYNQTWNSPQVGMSSFDSNPFHTQ
jgi:E3 SUMO-protein ligase PIAS1